MLWLNSLSAKLRPSLLNAERPQLLTLQLIHQRSWPEATRLTSRVRHGQRPQAGQPLASQGDSLDSVGIWLLFLEEGRRIYRNRSYVRERISPQSVHGRGCCSSTKSWRFPALILFQIQRDALAVKQRAPIGFRCP